MATHSEKVIENTYHKLFNSNDICHGYECPKYTLKKKTDNYELRCYPSYTWVGTSHTGERWMNNKEQKQSLHYLEYNLRWRVSV